MTSEKDVGEKQGEGREQKVLPAEKTPAVSYSGAPAPTAALRDVGISLPGGPFRSPLPRHSRREGAKAEPPGSCCCPDAPGHRVEGRDKHSLNGLPGQGSA